MHNKILKCMFTTNRLQYKREISCKVDVALRNEPNEHLQSCEDSCLQFRTYEKMVEIKKQILQEP